MTDAYDQNPISPTSAGDRSMSPNGFSAAPVSPNGAERVASPYGSGVKSANGVDSFGAAAGQPPKKKLNNWVGFSNLPNQVHRRSVRWVLLLHM